MVFCGTYSRFILAMPGALPYAGAFPIENNARSAGYLSARTIKQSYLLSKYIADVLVDALALAMGISLLSDYLAAYAAHAASRIRDQL